MAVITKNSKTDRHFLQNGEVYLAKIKYGVFSRTLLLIDIKMKKSVA